MAKRRYDIDEARIAAWLKEGRGQGHGKTYKPWLKIQDVPSTGRSSRLLGDTTKRTHHLLSDLERGVCLALDGSAAVIDIREQFPLPREDTIAIAGEMGVKHPRHGGIDIVMTTDFLVDVRTGGDVRLEAIAVKPASALDDMRTIEKLEIERRYWLGRGVAWRISTEFELSFGEKMMALWCHGMNGFEHFDAPSVGDWPERCERLIAELERGEEQPLRALFGRLERDHGFAPGDALTVIRHLLHVGRLTCVGDGGFAPRGLTSQLGVERPMTRRRPRECARHEIPACP